MDFCLQNRVAIITGGTKGIGLDIAKTLAAEGVKVCIVSRTERDIQRVCSEIKCSGGIAFGYAADVTCREQVHKIVNAIAEEAGNIDFLINNAGGINKFGALQELTNEDWMDSFKLNILSCINFVQECQKFLMQSDQARIITISSITGLQPGFFNPHYSACKAASINLTKHLANIYAESQILCNVICAGPVHSSSWEENVASLAKKQSTNFEEMYAQMEKIESAKIPLGRVGEPEDISSMVTFLLSVKANWITGSCIHVSGGKYSGIN